VKLDGASGNWVTNAVLGGNADYRVFGNGGDDLADGNPGCDDNTWLHNDFGTRSQSCIR
jgi:hypothetical protein